MQLLCSSSTEGGINNGLDLVSAKASVFDKNKARVPHVGYNQIAVKQRVKNVF